MIRVTKSPACEVPWVRMEKEGNGTGAGERRRPSLIETRILVHQFDRRLGSQTAEEERRPASSQESSAVPSGGRRVRRPGSDRPSADQRPTLDRPTQQDDEC